MKKKHASDSYVEMNHLVLPSHANTLGTIFGGKMMSWIDIAAAICATRHSRQICVTASIDRLTFISPAVIGDNVILKSRVVWTGRTSLVMAVDAVAENPVQGKREKCASAFLTFVALDKKHKPTQVPPLILKTKKEKQEFDAAAKRKKALLEAK